MAIINGINVTLIYGIKNTTKQLNVVVDNTTTTNAESETDDYDAAGAMQFIICTVVVYATFGVFCTLVESVKRQAKSYSGGNQDEAISNYLKREKKLKFEGYQQRLQYVCERYSDEIRQYEEKVDLLDIQHRLQQTDLGLKLDMTSKSSSKSKRHRQRRHGQPSMDTTVGRMGFSLIYTVDSDRGGSETDDDKGGQLRVHGRGGRGPGRKVTGKEETIIDKEHPVDVHVRVHDGDVESNIDETDVDV